MSEVQYYFVIETYSLGLRSFGGEGVANHIGIHDFEKKWHIPGVSILETKSFTVDEVMKETFSSGVETIFLCEQVTDGVTSFGELLYQRRSQRRPKQKKDIYIPSVSLKKQANLGVKRLEGKS